MKINALEESHPALSAPGYLSHHASRVFHRVVETEMKEHGLSVALLGPLLMLSRHGSMMQKDLVKGLAVAQPALVAILSKLEGEGLVEREANVSDARAKLISLTAKGKKQAARGKGVLEKVNRLGLEGFSEPERERVVTLLTRFISNLEKHE